jgi:hypothetical protein
MSGALTPAEFATKWAGSTRTEKAAAQEHFIDLCQMLGAPTPNEDPSGADYAFEKGVTTTGGGEGFADLWRRGLTSMPTSPCDSSPARTRTETAQTPTWCDPG